MDRTHILADGTVLELRPISSMVVHYLNTSTKGKPEAPLQDVPTRKGKKRKEPNPDDPDYQKALTEWGTDKSFRMMKYLICKGISSDPPEDEEEALRAFFPDESADELRYIWVFEKLGDDEKASGALIDAILGQTTVTEEGLAEAEAIFPTEDGGGEPVRVPSDGEDAPDPG